MKEKYLKTHLNHLQNEYLSLLKKSRNKITSEDCLFVIDEIKVFWAENKNLVDLIIDTLYASQNTYIFTGTTNIDIKNKELYPFMVLGNHHIIDDSISNLSINIQNVHNNDYLDQLKDTIISCIDDSIEVLEKYPDYLSILPVSYFIASEEILGLNKSATNFFFSLFESENLTVETFFKKYKKVEDIIADINPQIKDFIIFSEYDVSNDILLNFNNFKKEVLPFGSEMPDAILFFTTVIGFFMRAISILFLSTKHDIIPYLRYPVIFNYFLLITTLTPKRFEVDRVLIKSKLAFSLYQNFDFDKIVDVDFLYFLKTCKKENLSAYILKMEEQENISNETNQEEIGNFVKKQLDVLYSKFNAVKSQQ